MKASKSDSVAFCLEEIQIEPATFSPSQVADITGLSPTQQRDWRRREIIPSYPKGHARFDLQLTASILVMKHLSVFDIGPGFSRSMAKHISSEVVFQALLSGGLEIQCKIHSEPRDRDEIEICVIQSICGSENSVPYSYAVVFSDGTFRFTNDLDPVLLISDRPAIVIPLAGLGEIMRKRTDRPLATAVF